MKKYDNIIDLIGASRTLSDQQYTDQYNVIEELSNKVHLNEENYQKIHNITNDNITEFKKKITQDISNHNQQLENLLKIQQKQYIQIEQIEHKLEQQTDDHKVKFDIEHELNEIKLTHSRITSDILQRLNVYQKN